MSSCLIGHTGLVGSTLLRTLTFDQHIHRANLASLQGASFDTVYCAGLPAEKWKANQAPQQDAENMVQLMQALATVKARQFILISTVDVYGNPQDCDEADTVPMASHAYGLHRWQFEQFVRQHFPGALIVRLPALFGPGLKKNVLFDLLHQHQLERINPASAFQWYPLAQLASDIAMLLQRGASGVVNLCPEPLATAQLVQTCFPAITLAPMAGPAARYAVQTRHADWWGRSGPYICDRASILAQLHAYVQTQLPNPPSGVTP